MQGCSCHRVQPLANETDEPLQNQSFGAGQPLPQTCPMYPVGTVDVTVAVQWTLLEVSAQTNAMPALALQWRPEHSPLSLSIKPNIVQGSPSALAAHQ